MLILTLSLVVWGQATTSCAITADDDEERPSVSELIDQLANKNTRPRHDGAKGSPIWPKDYDWSEQERIRKVWRKLHGRADEDLNELFNHLEDGRYCLTMASPSGAYNDWTIGDLCYHILRVNIEPYQRPGDKRFEVLLPYHNDRDRNKSIHDWWKSRRDKSLLDLQLESIEHARNGTMGRLERAKDERARKRLDDGLAHLEELRAKIEETGEPIRVRAIESDEFGFHVPEKKR